MEQINIVCEIRAEQLSQTTPITSKQLDPAVEQLKEIVSHTSKQVTVEQLIKPSIPVSQAPSQSEEMHVCELNLTGEDYSVNVTNQIRRGNTSVETTVVSQVTYEQTSHGPASISEAASTQRHVTPEPLIETPSTISETSTQEQETFEYFNETRASISEASAEGLRPCEPWVETPTTISETSTQERVTFEHFNETRASISDASTQGLEVTFEILNETRTSITTSKAPPQRQVALEQLNETDRTSIPEASAQEQVTFQQYNETRGSFSKTPSQEQDKETHTSVLTLEGVDYIVTVTKQFRCGDSDETKVFSLCYVDKDPPVLMVSYENVAENPGAPVQEFTESGTCVQTHSNLKGKTSTKRGGRGWYYDPLTQEEDGVSAVYNKDPRSPPLVLFSTSNNEFRLKEPKAESVYATGNEDGLKVTLYPYHKPKGLDVNVTNEYFAVASVRTRRNDTPRQIVSVYKRDDSIGESRVERILNVHAFEWSYPLQPDVPESVNTDVMFYTLGGLQYLLVADQGNSNIGVVSFSTEKYTTITKWFLCQDCPLLKKPTALTLDLLGRIWVACTGGDILTIKIEERK